jgi:biofilm PGA synthesis N-glycosyltransferase PgaC
MNLDQIIAHTTPIHWAILSLLAISFLVQCYYYLGVYVKLPLYKTGKIWQCRKGISVIICARNEAHHLKQFLPRILEQDYPLFEVVVVNDGSTDGTEALLGEMAASHPRLRYTTLPPCNTFSRGKKLALTVGLKSANYDHVLLTDADCYPASKKWLASMTSCLDKEKSIVLGYGRYEKKRGILNALIRYETAFTAMQYFSFALKGKPYMGVGRNLAYNKSLFFGGRGFANHYHLASGDDDLFVNQHARAGNTAIVPDPEAHTISVPESSPGTWIRQKQRHISAGNLYKPWSRFRLGTEWFSRLVFYTAFIVACSITPWTWFVVGLFVLFQGIRITVFKLAARRLNENDLLLPSFLFDPVLPLLLGLIWFSNIFVTKYQPWS